MNIKNMKNYNCTKKIIKKYFYELGRNHSLSIIRHIIPNGNISLSTNLKIITTSKSH